MDAIVKIIESYKGVSVASVSIFGQKSLTIMIKADGANGKNMPLAATKILNKYSDVEFVHFTGGFMEHVYTRRTLSYLGYKIKKVA